MYDNVIIFTDGETTESEEETTRVFHRIFSTAKDLFLIGYSREHKKRRMKKYLGKLLRYGDKDKKRVITRIGSLPRTVLDIISRGR